MSKEYVQTEIAAAREALDDLRGARVTALSTTLLINRAYFACFHAARAVLYERGHEPGTHAGVVSQFGQQVVLAGDVPRVDGRLLNELSTLRNEADYGYSDVDTNVEQLLTDVTAFLRRAESLVE